MKDVLARGKDGIAAPEVDVYRELTTEKPSDVVLYRTRFGTAMRAVLSCSIVSGRRATTIGP